MIEPGDADAVVDQPNKLPRRRRPLQVRLLGLMMLVVASALAAFAVIRGPVTYERMQQYWINRPILIRLGQPFGATLASPATLEDLLEAIKEQTADATLLTGIPIYVDPIGLMKADRTPLSPVCPEVEGRTIREVLQQSLDALGLDYKVERNMLLITSREAVDAGNRTFR